MYAAARRIAAEIKKTKNVDGFIVNSFFTDVAQEPVGQNYCFFEQPLLEQRLALSSLNRLHLKTVSYDYIFGPTFPTVGPTSS